MSDNQGKKLKLNLNAKEFKPKSLQTQNQQMMQPPNQPMMPNPYMGYGMGGQFDYMNYQNQFMMPNSSPYEVYNQGFMNQPQINQNYQQPSQVPQPSNVPQTQNDNDDGIVGLKKKKNKKKKAQEEPQNDPKPHNQNQNQNKAKVNQMQNQFNQMNLGNNQQPNQKKQQQKPKEKKEDKKEEKPKKKRR